MLSRGHPYLPFIGPRATISSSFYLVQRGREKREDYVVHQCLVIEILIGSESKIAGPMI